MHKASCPIWSGELTLEYGSGNMTCKMHVQLTRTEEWFIRWICLRTSGKYHCLIEEDELGVLWVGNFYKEKCRSTRRGRLTKCCNNKTPTAGLFSSIQTYLSIYNRPEQDSHFTSSTYTRSRIDVQLVPRWSPLVITTVQKVGCVKRHMNIVKKQLQGCTLTGNGCYRAM